MQSFNGLKSSRKLRRISGRIATFDTTTDHASSDIDETYNCWMVFNETSVQQSYENFRSSSDFSIIHFGI